MKLLHTQLLQIKLPCHWNNNDVMIRSAESVGLALSHKTSISGVACRKTIVEGRPILNFYDFYTIEDLGFNERLRHLLRKIKTAVLGDMYMKLILPTPI